ncbi:MAG: flagellar motor switch protein FliG [Pseudomonadaceae bacterium]|nr:flagellar motor switch protein FliG [Pseudomonadaceae bacterium]
MAEATGEELAPLDKAAILLLALGDDQAATILKHLEPREVQRLGAAMAALSDVSSERIGGVVDTFLDSVSGRSGLTIGASDSIRKMLVGALGEDKAKGVLDRILDNNTDGLDKLRWMDPRNIAEFIVTEHPQIQAIVLSYLEANQAAEVLDYYPSIEARTDVMMRVAALDSVPPSALQDLSAVLEEQVRGAQATRFASLGGAKVAAEIMNNLDGAVGEEVLDGIRETDETLGEKIQEMMFVFENLLALDDRGVQTLLREVNTDILVIALKGADHELREKIYSNMSKRAAELLQDDLEAKGPVRVSEVDTAQKEILTIARRLAEAGEIMLGGSGDEML